ACPQGTFKSIQGAGLCQQCPLNSRSTIEAATLCGCRNGYYRGDMDKPEDVCTSVPSAPRNVVSVVNQTSVQLEWHSPRDIGHREDLSYNVLCRRCHSSERRACQPCDDSVAFVPGKRGLKETRVEISKLRAHTSYTFDIQPNGIILDYEIRYYDKSGAGVVPEQELGTRAVSPGSAASTNMMAEEQRVKRTLTEEAKKRKGESERARSRRTRSQTSVLNSSVVQSEMPSVVLEGLRPGTGYVVQVRARTVAGYGAYSKDMLFQTLTDGSLVGGVCIVSLVAIVIICTRRRQLKESVYGDKLQQYNTGGEVTLRPDMFSGTTPTVTFPTLSEGHSSPGVKIYIDPFTYEDPNEAVREFAKEIDPSCVKIEEVIGSGEFGEVYKGRLKPVGKKEIPVAIKTLKVGYSERQRRDFLSEASIMGQFDQPNIIRLEGVVTKSRPTMIITEFMENGALDSFLRGGKIPVRWTAPEAIAYRKFTSASDVWSYGIVTWEVINAIEQDFRLPAPMDCPVVLHQLMLDCWQKDRNARPKFPDIVSMLDKMIRNPASLKAGTNNIAPGPSHHPLLDRGAPDLSMVSSVEDWLAALKMTQDLQRIGVSLAGHQKKILTSVQSMRHNIDDQSPTESV
ncbi:Ephrin type-B receptor 1, partial [Nibea albiflora]